MTSDQTSQLQLSSLIGAAQTAHHTSLGSTEVSMVLQNVPAVVVRKPLPGKTVQLAHGSGLPQINPQGAPQPQPSIKHTIGCIRSVSCCRMSQQWWSARQDSIGAGAAQEPSCHTWYFGAVLTVMTMPAAALKFVRCRRNVTSNHLWTAPKSLRCCRMCQLWWSASHHQARRHRSWSDPGSGLAPKGPQDARQ